MAWEARKCVHLYTFVVNVVSRSCLWYDTWYLCISYIRTRCKNMIPKPCLYICARTALPVSQCPELRVMHIGMPSKLSQTHRRECLSLLHEMTPYRIEGAKRASPLKT